MNDIVIAGRKAAELAELMADCAQSVHDDDELTVAGNGVNSTEAMRVLDAVAEIVGIDGPRAILNRQYGDAW